MNITIKVKFKNVELEMSPDEAKELVEVLKGITGGETVKWYPYYPYKWETTPWPSWTTKWTTTCSDTKGTTVYNLSCKE